MPQRQVGHIRALRATARPTALLVRLIAPGVSSGAASVALGRLDAQGTRTGLELRLMSVCRGERVEAGPSKLPHWVEVPATGIVRFPMRSAVIHVRLRTYGGNGHGQLEQRKASPHDGVLQASSA